MNKIFAGKSSRLLKEDQSRKRKRSARSRKTILSAEVVVLPSGKRMLHVARREVASSSSNQNSSFANGQKILREIGSFDMRKAAIEAGVITKSGELTKNYA